MSETNSLPHVEKTSAKISTEAQCSVTQNKDTGVKPPAEGDDENPRTSTPAAGSKRPGNDDKHPVINLTTVRTKPLEKMTTCNGVQNLQYLIVSSFALCLFLFR